MQTAKAALLSGLQDGLGRDSEQRDSTLPPPPLSLRMSISRVYPAIAPAEKVPCVGMGMMR